MSTIFLTIARTPSRRTVSAFQRRFIILFRCRHLRAQSPAGFSRLSVPCSVLPDGEQISPAASAAVRKPSAGLCTSVAVTLRYRSAAAHFCPVELLLLSLLSGGFKRNGLFITTMTGFIVNKIIILAQIPDVVLLETQPLP
ncbi:hypothetical protein ACLB1O_09345 [Escherichia coli]